jgi:hypothetical protein
VPGRRDGRAPRGPVERGDPGPVPAGRGHRRLAAGDRHRRQPVAGLQGDGRRRRAAPAPPDRRRARRDRPRAPAARAVQAVGVRRDRGPRARPAGRLLVPLLLGRQLLRPAVPVRRGRRALPHPHRRLRPQARRADPHRPGRLQVPRPRHAGRPRHRPAPGPPRDPRGRPGEPQAPAAALAHRVGRRRLADDGVRRRASRGARRLERGVRRPRARPPLGVAVRPRPRRPADPQRAARAVRPRAGLRHPPGRARPLHGGRGDPGRDRRRPRPRGRRARHRGRRRAGPGGPRHPPGAVEPRPRGRSRPAHVRPRRHADRDRRRRGGARRPGPRGHPPVRLALGCGTFASARVRAT